VSDPLLGCVVAITREQRGELGRLLDEAGATVVHVPLIAVVDPEPADATRLSKLWVDAPDWVVVTSAAGAERVAEELRRRPDVRVGAVGTATGRRIDELIGRPAEIVPDRQLATELVAAFAERVSDHVRVLVAQADRADSALVDGLRALGHDVVAATAYRTVLRVPDRDDVDGLTRADAVVFASGSAATAWSDALGAEAAALLPELVVAIGPTTGSVLRDLGLSATHTAMDHSLRGVISTLSEAWAARRSST
jgi:uroporphyrinogen-III synthase